MKVSIGVDPGRKGAYSVIKDELDGTVSIVSIAWDDESFARDMRQIKNDADSIGWNVCACVESVHSLPHEGVKSAFSFGKSCGYIEGVLRALQIPYQTVIPQKWKKEWSLTNDKKQSIETCKKLYPSLSLRASDRCRTDSDGLAEAALIATWGKRHF